MHVADRRIDVAEILAVQNVNDVRHVNLEQPISGRASMAPLAESSQPWVWTRGALSRAEAYNLSRSQAPCHSRVNEDERLDAGHDRHNAASGRFLS